MALSKFFSTVGRGLNYTISKWFNEDIEKFRRDVDEAFKLVESSANGLSPIFVPNGLPASTAVTGKTITGSGFGTTLADIDVYINGVAQTVTGVTATTITFNLADQGKNHGEVVSVVVTKKDIPHARLDVALADDASIAEVHNIVGGIKATDAVAGKLISGLGFGTTLADIAVIVNGVSQTVNAVTNIEINFDLSDLGLTAGDCVSVVVKKKGIKIFASLVETIA